MSHDTMCVLLTLFSLGRDGLDPAQTPLGLVMEGDCVTSPRRLRERRREAKSGYSDLIQTF